MADQVVTDPTSALARYIADLRFEDIPEPVIDKAKQCLMDAIGIIIGALKIQDGRDIVEFASECAGPEEATLLGSGIRRSLLTAVFTHGSLSEVLEFQDGRPRTGLHQGTSVIPAALATGELAGISGRDLLTSIVAAYEVINRIGASTHARTFGRVMTTGVFGAFGAAAAAGKVFGLTSETILNAFGIAGFLTPLSVGENFWTAPSCKPLQGGQGAEAGVKSILLAKRGFRGSPNILVGSPPRYVGVCNVICDHPDIGAITQGLGEEYTILEGYFKAYPCGGITHGALECIISLKQEHGFRADDIEKMVVTTNSSVAWTVGQIQTTSDSTYGECQLSLRYVAAVVAFDGELTQRQFTPERRKDPSVHTFASKIMVKSDPAFDALAPAIRPTKVEIRTVDGRILTKQVNYPKGNYENPMTWDELETKYRQLTEGVLDAGKVSESIQLLRELESVLDIKELIRRLVN